MKIVSIFFLFLGISLNISSVALNAQEGATFDLDPTNACYEPPSTECNTGCCCGIWLPEAPPLFRPFVADPRQINFSAGWRFNDQVFVKNVIDVSFGDLLTLYRWCNIGPWNGQLEVAIEGGVWAVFDPLHNSSPLMNADYYGGLTLNYAKGQWAFRLRAFHISCHVGDEFLLNHLGRFDRRNPSAEFLDLFCSYYLNDEIRVYGGLGAVVGQDESFASGRFYTECGVELHMSQLGFINECQQIYGRPFFGMDFRFQSKQNNHINQTYVLGYEWGKLTGLQRVLRFYMEYHDGYSVEGQFAHFPTNYFSLRASYGF